MRNCRFCAEEIQDAAIVCKHCGRDLIPGRPAAPLPAPVLPRAIAKTPWPLWMKVGAGVLGLLVLRWLYLSAGAMFGSPELIVLAVIVGVVVLVVRARGSAVSLYCPTCGTVGRPITRTNGSFLIEVVLWICFIIPGVIYSLWRLTSKARVCPTCGALHMIPVDSPKARAALAK